MSGRVPERGEPPPDASAARLSDDIERDARDLRRGVAINLLGYAIKIGNPVLTWAALYLYGSRNYGFFVAGQATVMIAFRICVLGFDKSLWWWVPQQQPGRAFTGLGSALLWTTLLGLLVSLGCFVGAPVLADWGDEPDAVLGLRWLALGIVPMAWIEVLVGAALGKRKMAAQVLVKDGFVPVATAALALPLYWLGMRVNGLPLAFVIARLLGVIGAVYFLYRETEFQTHDLLPRGLPRPLLRYSIPVWLSELLYAFMQRMDVLALTALTTPATVGAYGAVLQVGNSLKSIRAAFDPIVIVILSEIGASKDWARLRASFSYATSLVLSTQIPLYALLLLFSDRILSLIGRGYEQAATGIIVLAGFSLFNTVTGLHGHVVRALGRSDLVLASVIFTGLLQAPLLYWLIPSLGLVGATLAVGLASVPPNLVWLFLTKQLTGTWLYGRSVGQVLVLGAASGLIAAAVWFGLRTSVESAASYVACLAFAAAYGGGLFWLYRRGLFKAGAH
jgi:O-antigen/teichoic acid export membrane protein